MIRTLIELSSRGVIFKRRFSAKFNRAQLFVTPESSLKYWFYDLEKVDPLLIKIAQNYIRKDDVVWDIGSNVGLFSFAAAAITGPGGKVLSIEPDIFLAGLQMRTTSLKSNQGLNVDILPVAVAGCVGIARLNIAGKERATNYLDSSSGSSQAGGVRRQVTVPTVTIDWLMEHYDPPDFVKIDIEGSEASGLGMASNMFTDARPVILCEVYSINEEKVSELFKKFRYVMYDAEAAIEGKLGGILNKPTYNILAFPEEHKQVRG